MPKNPECYRIQKKKKTTSRMIKKMHATMITKVPSRYGKIAQRLFQRFRELLRIDHYACRIPLQ